ncbi:multisubunit Na+/H+ antiporter MnhB subunit [Anoxybacillus tepidamans]|uniref:Multisubunit Na+/H+ antiporter MnhB subunit n=1 Tax=Anoxybacteroides tepidamans TaxID=265948 RepID=A0A7W8IMV8_9BACL|nr:hypothetical protein [Anoxybacillus tepidamans]MBB5323425.1 multisubunit Na+/H+ antiporter MnhB subunit [Anoxybacillus tepidamans]
MKLGFIFGIVMLVTCIWAFEWPRFKRAPKKEKTVFAILLGMGAALAIVLLYYPDIPGPTQLIDYIYKSLGRRLE